MAKMTAPVHPGEIVRDHVLPNFGVNIVRAAEILKTARPGLNLVLNGKRSLSYELALKIEAAFGVSADMLMTAQTNFDMAAARAKAGEITAGIERVRAVA
jgi:addiction module HigA family antidote